VVHTIGARFQVNQESAEFVPIEEQVVRPFQDGREAGQLMNGFGAGEPGGEAHQRGLVGSQWRAEDDRAVQAA
ncbi:MAG TPA: hypothetical protein VFS62_12925, partial [Chloroflexota bacterium]|nr:hypothetical protein [Chloroflexota bacterium]